MQKVIESQKLRRGVLVLNKNWQAIQVTTVARAVTLLFAKEARVVDPSDYSTYDWTEWCRRVVADGSAVIRSASIQLAIPEVVLLASFDRLPRLAVNFSRRNVLQRDRCTCQFCGSQPGTANLTIDHVVPRSHGGETNWENCVTACWNCNRDKANRTPQQAGMALRRLPVRPVWEPTFSRAGSNPRWRKFVG